MLFRSPELAGERADVRQILHETSEFEKFHEVFRDPDLSSGGTGRSVMHDCRIDENEVQDVSDHHPARKTGFVVFLQLFHHAAHAPDLKKLKK